jgi:uncharacterized repeat protein (TIGR03803 family)
MQSRKPSIALAFLFAICAALVAISTATAFAQTETVLFSFGAPPVPSKGGINPSGNLVFDSKGNLYGTTVAGGRSDSCAYNDNTSCGVAFELGKVGGVWTEKVLHTFSNNGTDGIIPQFGMIFDAAGNLYGTTMAGGLYGDGGSFGGIAFELSPAGNGKWTEKILYNFMGGETTDVGDLPSTPLVFDAAGNLYGATSEGGASVGHESLGCGSVYELTLNTEGSWAANSLHTFLDKTDGCYGTAVILGPTGGVFGAAFGGFANQGVVFELTPGSGGVWTDQILDDFPTGGSNGPNNAFDLVFGSQGDLFGTSDGSGTLYKYGTVFELTPSTGGTWTQSVLYAFGASGDGKTWHPLGLIFDKAGNLYGFTNDGGTDNYGTVFKLTPATGGSWTETVLHSFAGGSDGANPSGLTLSSSGELYGTTLNGGTYNGGTVFKIVP